MRISRIAVLIGLLLLLILSSVSVLAQVSERDRGIELYRAGKFAEAVVVLQKVVEADREDKLARVYLGGALINTGKAKDAKKVFPKFDPKEKLLTLVDEEISAIKRPRPRYTDEARANQISGAVVMIAEYKADGTIGFVIPIRSLMFGLTESAVDSVKTIAFKPAVKNGKPVSVIQLITTTFEVY